MVCSEETTQGRQDHRDHPETKEEAASRIVPLDAKWNLLVAAFTYRQIRRETNQIMPW
jgi:hypothetical protein